MANKRGTPNNKDRETEELQNKVAELEQQLSEAQGALVSSENDRSKAENNSLKLEKELKAEKEKNARLEHNAIQRNVKDSVFTHLFSMKEYALQLYKDLFPDDAVISQEDIRIFTLSSVLTNQPYNDLGLLIRDILIVLVEAQTTWSENIIFRLVGYFYNSVIKYLNEHNQKIYGEKTVTIPKIKAFVLYAGPEKVDKSFLSLRDVFYGGDQSQPDFFATVIQASNGTGILGEYIGFCDVLNTQLNQYNDSEKAILATIEICIQKGFLAKYLNSHRKEVYDIMVNYFKTLYLDRDEFGYKSYIRGLLDFEISDKQIKDALIKRYKSLTDEAAEELIQFVREHPDKDEW